jgi:sulfur relay protein TusB/DsrH
MRILHILRENRDKWPFELAEAQQKLGYDVAVLLIHDAVLARQQSGIKVYSCLDDVVARGVKMTSEGAEVVDYDAIVRLCFEYDSVSIW